MWKIIVVTLLLCTLISQVAMAVHPLLPITNSCLYVSATPHRPDPRPNDLTPTPEQRCVWADTYALSNVPTTPVAVISPSGESRNYCTLDGSTIATPDTVHDVDHDLAESLSGATACTGDNKCVKIFGGNATCESFGPDASGSSGNGWTSLGPASSIAVASPLDGSTGAHSVYVRSAGGLGHIFYFNGGMNRNHSLTGPAGLQVLDITFCKAESPVVQRRQDPDCEGFFCRPIPCCGPHFPCDGAPDLVPLGQEFQDSHGHAVPVLDGWKIAMLMFIIVLLVWSSRGGRFDV